MKSATSKKQTSNKRIKNEYIDFVTWFQLEAEIELTRQQILVLVEHLDMFKDSIQSQYFVRINQAISAVKFK